MQTLLDSQQVSSSSYGDYQLLPSSSVCDSQAPEEELHWNLPHNFSGPQQDVGSVQYQTPSSDSHSYFPELCDSAPSEAANQYQAPASYGPQPPVSQGDFAADPTTLKCLDVPDTLQSRSLAALQRKDQTSSIPEARRCERLIKKGTVPCGRTASYGPNQYDGQALCKKHGDQWESQHADNPSWPFIYRTAKQAIENIFPPVKAPIEMSGREDESLERYRDYHRDWTARFLAAAKAAYVVEEGTPLDDLKDWLLKQQAKLNANNKNEKKSFDAGAVNDRISLLFEIALRYHEGGNAIYPAGGDNGGYSQDPTLKFLNRLEEIESYLRLNKLIVIDVIEGRGVEAFVRDPAGFHGRKTANLKGNLKKKRLEAGIQAASRSNSPSARNKTDRVSYGRKRKRSEITSVVFSTPASHETTWNTDEDACEGPYQAQVPVHADNRDPNDSGTCSQEILDALPYTNGFFDGTYRPDPSLVGVRPQGMPEIDEQHQRGSLSSDYWFSDHGLGGL